MCVEANRMKKATEKRVTLLILAEPKYIDSHSSDFAQQAKKRNKCLLSE